MIEFLARAFGGDKADPPKGKKRVNLTLQGGGAHGAFTWGVLDQLLEDGRLVIEGLSGTSAGALNAVMVADGLARLHPSGVGLDVDDVKISARKGTLRILGKGEKVREVPLHPALRAVLADWLAERGDWPGAHGAALLLNQRGGRLSARGAGDIITAIATDAHLDGEGVSAHPLRHTFVTTLVRGGTDLVTVAELAGHARLETTRAYSLPTDEDKTKALNLLITDQ